MRKNSGEYLVSRAMCLMQFLKKILLFQEDGNSLSSKQYIPSRMKLGIALYYMAHYGDAIHFGVASGLSKATALKYLHQVAAHLFTANI